MMRDDLVTRREAVARVGALLTGNPAVPPRLAPREQLVNVLEYEEQARAALAADVYALIAGGDRSAFDRITLRPRRLGGLACWTFKDRMAIGAARRSSRAPGSPPRTRSSCCETSAWTRRAIGCEGPSTRFATAAPGARSSATRRFSKARSSPVS